MDYHASSRMLDACLARLRDAEKSCAAAAAAVVSSTAAVEEIQGMLASSKQGNGAVVPLPRHSLTGSESPTFSTSSRQAGGFPKPTDDLILDDDVLVNARNPRTNSAIADRSRKQADSREKEMNATNEDISFILFKVGSIFYLPVLHPGSTIRVGWLLMMGIFILFALFVTPLELCFNYEATGFMLYANMVVDIALLLDIGATCTTAVQTQHGDLIFSPRKILDIYVRGWLLPDALSGIPWSLLPSFDSARIPISGDGRVSWPIGQLLRMFRILRMFRLVKVKQQIMASLESQDSDRSKSLQFKLGLAFILLPYMLVVHWLACFWYLAGTLGPPENTWLTVYAEKYPGTNQLYWWSVYYQLVTMTTVGYGDIHPNCTQELILSLFALPLASVCFAFMMGSLSDSIAHFNRAKRAVDEKRSVLNRYLSSKQVPTYLRWRIRRAVGWGQSDPVDFEKTLLPQLPNSVCEELCLHSYQRILLSAPVLSWLVQDSVTLRKVAVLLQPRIGAKGDYLVNVGQAKISVLIVVKGEIRIYSNVLNQLAEYRRVPKLSLREALLRLGNLNNHGNIFFDDGQQGEDPAMWNILQGSASVSDNLLLKAAATLEAESALKLALVALLQQRWRQIRRSRIQVVTEAQRSRLQRSQSCRSLSKHTAAPQPFKSCTVLAPSYIGDSCLWTPISTWTDEHEPPTYSYSAKFLGVGECLELPRAGLRCVMLEFAPWLPVRFARYQELVRRGFDTEITTDRELQSMQGDIFSNL